MVREWWRAWSVLFVAIIAAIAVIPICQTVRLGFDDCPGLGRSEEPAAKISESERAAAKAKRDTAKKEIHDLLLSIAANLDARSKDKDSNASADRVGEPNATLPGDPGDTFGGIRQFRKARASFVPFF